MLSSDATATASFGSITTARRGTDSSAKPNPATLVTAAASPTTITTPSTASTLTTAVSPSALLRRVPLRPRPGCRESGRSPAHVGGTATRRLVGQNRRMQQICDDLEAEQAALAAIVADLSEE